MRGENRYLHWDLNYWPQRIAEPLTNSTIKSAVNA